MKNALRLKYEPNFITTNKILKNIWMGLIEMDTNYCVPDFLLVFLEQLKCFRLCACPRNGDSYIFMALISCMSFRLRAEPLVIKCIESSSKCIASYDLSHMLGTQ